LALYLRKKWRMQKDMLAISCNTVAAKEEAKSEEESYISPFANQ
jgi:hypothetical protein